MLQEIAVGCAESGKQRFFDYVEGPVFRGSRHMRVESLVVALTEELVRGIPDLGRMPLLVIVKALPIAKQRLVGGLPLLGAGPPSLAPTKVSCNVRKQCSRH